MQWSAVVQELSNRTPQSLQDRQSLTIYNDCDEHADVADRSTQLLRNTFGELILGGQNMCFVRLLSNVLGENALLERRQVVFRSFGISLPAIGICLKSVFAGYFRREEAFLVKIVKYCAIHWQALNPCLNIFLTNCVVLYRL